MLDMTLEDSRQHNTEFSLQVFSLNTTAQFLQFELLGWYGLGGGLQYLDIQRLGMLGRGLK